MQDLPLPPVPSKHQRFSESAKFLPVGFVILNIGGLYAIYMGLHIWPTMHTMEKHNRAVRECWLFNFICALLVTCYVRCILVHPGTIPSKEEDPIWEYVPQEPRRGGAGSNQMAGLVHETKRTGDRRHCKWCGKYKPDRCHHCRVCRTCILKMDHHCPWIYNCVGFGNHKYFFLLVFYAAVACHFITLTMSDTVRASMYDTTPFIRMFLVLFGATLASFIGIVVTVFFGFHVWLMLKSMTTIEFCEKSVRKRLGHDESVYDQGIFGNITAVLGENVLLWLLPLSPPVGDGMYFPQDGEVAPVSPDDYEAYRSLYEKGSPTYGANR